MPYSFEATLGTCVVRLQSWEAPAAWLRPASSADWYAWTPDLDVVAWLDGHGAESLGQNVEGITPGAGEDAFAAFARSIPEPVRKAVGVFPERQFHLVRLTAIIPELADIARSNPCLAFMLTLPAYFTGTPRHAWWARAHDAHLDVECVRGLVRRRQRTTLTNLGFPAEGSVGVVRKVVPAALTLQRCRALRAALHRRGVRERLVHLPRVNAGVLALVSEELEAHTTAGFLEAVALDAGQDREATTAALVRDAVSLARQVGRDLRGLVFRSGEHVCAVHDELVQEWQAQHLERRPHARRQADPRPGTDTPSVERPFPSPPIPGTDAIIPITTPALLREEAQRMKNCCATYAARIRRRKCYVYRVLEPERATLSITRTNDEWAIEELRRATNKDANAETWTAIRAWLATAPRAHLLRRRRGRHKGQQLALPIH
jgi:hypothetical protein